MATGSQNLAQALAVIAGAFTSSQGQQAHSSNTAGPSVAQGGTAQARDISRQVIYMDVVKL